MSETDLNNFRKIKEEFRKDTLRAYPDFETDKPFILETDWSHLGVGAILKQEQGGVERFIACKSRANNKHESHYPAHKGELQALVFACKKFEHLLSYRPFILRTDSTYLKQLETAKDLSGIFYRWINYLSRFEIMVEYTKGSNNPADGLSRVCWPMGLGDDRESLGGDGLEQTVNQLGSGSYLKPRKD